MTQLVYRSHALIEDLGVGECTMHRASGSSAARWWQLWFRVQRDDNGQPETLCVPMSPGGGYVPNGPGGKTWGLARVGLNTWQVSPSIKVDASGDAHASAAGLPSIWHQTPMIVAVPDDEPWARGGKP